MVKFGVMGYGFMGHIHVEKLMQRTDCQVVAVCDTDPEKMADVPAGIQTYGSMDELLEKADINTVLISVPNHIHLEAVDKAAHAGKDILCEKPVALTLEELERMEEILRETGVKFSVHQQRRWDWDFRTAKEVYDSKTLGDVYTIQSKLYGFNGNMHDWHVYPEFGGGMLFDWGVHLIDQMLFMVDSKITSVYADLRNVINENVDDYFKIILSFENGVTGEIELGTYFLADREKWFERHWFIGGNQGSMYSDCFAPEGKIVRTTRLLTNVPGKTTMTASGPTRSFGPPSEGLIVTEPLPHVVTDQTFYYDNFIKALNGEEDFVVTLPQVRRVLRLMNAVRESAKTHKSVDFE
ncbi:MAG: Gfo/Idh/MocA family oxidoreductase [Clostridiales bacterium]|nr:Gfo/Idh/MocA family oxidoreductase [Clostridiales bacterium]